MKQDPNFSVVIPVFNNALSTIRAVKSIIRQTSPALEIILVDDASDVSCGIKLQRYIDRCHLSIPIRLYRLTKNSGPGLARHRGAQEALGSYVAFLDADDLWHVQKLEQVRNAILDTGANLLGHNRPWKMGISPQDIHKVSGSVRVRELHKIDFLKRNPIPTSSIVVGRDIARKMFCHGGRRSEDYMALVVAQRVAQRTIYLEADLCWASKPPFGASGEGADQVAIYRASAKHMIKLWRDDVITNSDLMIFFCYFVVRVPIGLIRLRRYQRLVSQPG